MVDLASLLKSDDASITNLKLLGRNLEWVFTPTGRKYLGEWTPVIICDRFDPESEVTVGDLSRWGPDFVDESDEPRFVVLLVNDDMEMKPIYAEEADLDGGPIGLDVSPDGRSIIWAFGCDDFIRLIAYGEDGLLVPNCDVLVDIPVGEIRFDKSGRIIGESYYGDGNWIFTIEDGTAVAAPEE